MMTTCKGLSKKIAFALLLAITGVSSGLLPANAIHPQDSENEDAAQLVAWDYMETLYCIRLYDASRNLLLQLRGGIPDFTPDGQHLITASPFYNRAYLYDLQGNQLAEFRAAGFLHGFTENGHVLFSSSDLDRQTTSLYDLAGNRLAQFEGELVGLSPNQQQFVTYSYRRAISYLYYPSGNQIAQFEGYFLGFSPDGQQLVTHHYRGEFGEFQVSYLYSIWGRRLAEFPGRFVRFSSDGRSLIVRDGEQNRVYDLLGHELDASQFSEDMNSGLVAGQALNLQLLDRRLQVSRNEVRPGTPDQIRGLSPDGQLLLTFNEDRIEMRRFEDGSTGSICPTIAR
jgi:WD40 repeat protein